MRNLKFRTLWLILTVCVLFILSTFKAHPQDSPWQLLNRFPHYTFHPQPSNSFAFSGSYPAFFVVTQALAMDISSATLSCTFSLSNSEDVVFRYGGQDISNFGPRPASARFSFASVVGYNNQGTGSTNYQFNSTWAEIGTNSLTGTLTASITPGSWSDAGGCAECPPPTEANFWYAVQHVVQIGVAFGGGDFYDVGIATTEGSSTFNLDSFTVTPRFSLAINSGTISVVGGFVKATYVVERSNDLVTWSDYGEIVGTNTLAAVPGMYRARQ